MLKIPSVNLTRLLLLQSVYYIFSGLWPLAHIMSFEAVTGYKQDLWLVQMVALLTIVIGGIIFTAVQRKSVKLEIKLLSVLSALSYALIDYYFALAGIISGIYLVDGFFQIVLIVSILFCWKKES